MLPITHIFGASITLAVAPGLAEAQGQMLIPILTFLAITVGVIVCGSFFITRALRLWPVR